MNFVWRFNPIFRHLPGTALVYRPIPKINTVWVLFLTMLLLSGIEIHADSSHGHLVGEYTLTESAAQEFLEARGDPTLIEFYRTLYVTRCVDGLQVESQAMHGGATLFQSEGNTLEFVNDPLQISVRFVDADSGNTNVNRLVARHGLWRGKYIRVARGGRGVDQPDEIFTDQAPGEAGLDPELIENLLLRIRTGWCRNMHGLVVVKNGRMVVEAYFNGSNCHHLHQIRSSGKSIASMIVGIAIDKGLIPSVNQKAFEYFPEQRPPNGWGELRERMTLRHLLTMTSGQACDDWVAPKFHCNREMYTRRDWVGYALNIPMAHLPGTHWAYSGASLMIISGVIPRATGMSFQDFTEKHLLAPLGIRHHPCHISPGGNGYPGGSAKLRARDMARIGYLMLNRGNWFGRQIISPRWVELSTGPSVKTSNYFSYGFLWWQGEREFGDHRVCMYYSAGNGGNNIFVFPDLDMVVVLTAGNYNDVLTNQIFGILAKYIVPAVLPQNSGGGPIEVDPASLDIYVGDYHRDNIHFIIEKQQGSLYRKRAGSKSRRLYLTAPNKFVDPSGRYDDGLVTFQKDENGRVTGLLWGKYWRTIQMAKASRS